MMFKNAYWKVAYILMALTALAAASGAPEPWLLL